MTAQEWAGLCGWLECCFKGELTNEQEAHYFRYLRGYSRTNVEAAIDALVLLGNVFVPTPAELVGQIEPPLPSFEQVWSMIFPVIRHASSYGEVGTIERVRQACGDVVAGWVASYGALRLAREPVFDDEYGGALLARIARGYASAVETVPARRQLVERLQNVLGTSAQPVLTA